MSIEEKSRQNASLTVKKMMTANKDERTPKKKTSKLSQDN